MGSISDAGETIETGRPTLPEQLEVAKAIGALREQLAAMTRERDHWAEQEAQLRSHRRILSENAAQHRERARWLEQVVVKLAARSAGVAMAEQEPYICIVFDGPPGPESGRFVEVETSDGKSIRLGAWRQRSDGLWSLDLPVVPVSMAEGLVDATLSGTIRVGGLLQAARAERDEARRVLRLMADSPGEVSQADIDGALGVGHG